jgi:hypothetical protein
MCIGGFLMVLLFLEGPWVSETFTYVGVAIEGAMGVVWELSGVSSFMVLVLFLLWDMVRFFLLQCTIPSSL